MSKFVHLHNHTHYSLLDAACTPAQLVAAAEADGQRAVALTDHGVMFGAMEFYKKAKSKGIKPIIGCEVYVANGSRFDRSAGKDRTKKKNYFHLVLLAKNQIGYQNLCKLTSLGHTEGFYYKPRIDSELIQTHHEGLIALSACAGGVMNAHILNGEIDEARKIAEFYQSIFKDDFYIELQNHFLDVDPPILNHAPRIAQDLGIKLVATNDCHYIRKEHAVAHNVLLHIKDVSAANAGMVDIFRLRYGKPEMYFKSQEEMISLLGSFPGAIENTLEIADKCSFSFNDSLLFPAFPIPEESNAQNLDDYMVELTYAGLREKFAESVQQTGELPPEVLDRIEFELGVIKKMGYAGYFLIVADFISAARKMGVSVGPGRGSAAGSLVAYALGITNVDPIKYDLLFERFLNPDRVSMPDIDVDFNDEKREKVIEYVKQKYGEKSVAQIVTFGTLSTKAVLKDVGRVLGIPLSTIDSITKPIPTVFGKVTPLKEALDLPELRWVKESDDPKIRQLIEYGLVLEGLARNTSLHAAGVVIAPGDLSDYVPLYKSPDSELCTQFNMKDLESAGLLKMDFLGLRTLSIIDKTIEMIKLNHNIEIDIDKIDLHDKETYELLGAGKTLSVFQFESEPMQKYLKMLKPTSLEDLTAMNALYRPGPMDNIPEFCDRKHGRKPIDYPHESMEASLQKTYGIIVYQEQVMQLVRDIAGFSLAQADLMRRAMGKKDVKLMAEQKSAFISGAKTHSNIDEKLAGEIFDLIEKFASYGFNKSHALAYSYLAYQTAWLKTHYTAEFLAANMTAEIGDMDKIVSLIDEARTFNINVLPPDVNESNLSFTVLGRNKIRFGMAAIKNVGENAVESIVTARTEKSFSSLFDFATRVDTRLVNRKAFEALICSGAFDSFGNGHRSQFFDAIDSALKFAQSRAKADENTMDSLFGDASEVNVVAEPKLPNTEPWNYLERLKKEKEFLNFYISGHPLEKYRAHVTSFSTHDFSKKEQFSPDKAIPIRAAGIITGIRTKLDKREQTIAFVTIEDFGGKAEVIFWSDAYKRMKDFLYEENMIFVVGRAELQGSESIKIIADEVMNIEETPARYAKSLHIRVNRDKITTEDLNIFYQEVEEYKGNGSLYFSIFSEDDEKIRRYHSKRIRIQPNHDIATKAMKIFGSMNVRFLGD